MTEGYTRYAAPNEVVDPSRNLEVTLLDALRIKNIHLLIVSFLIRETHNKYILFNQNYKAKEQIMPIYYQLGAIAGLLVTGVAADLFLRKQRFFLLFILNTMLLLWDIYLFVDASSAQRTTNAIFDTLLGFFMTGNDLVYLILIPMYIARQM